MNNRHCIIVGILNWDPVSFGKVRLLTKNVLNYRCFTWWKVIRWLVALIPPKIWTSSIQSQINNSYIVHTSRWWLRTRKVPIVFRKLSYIIGAAPESLHQFRFKYRGNHLDPVSARFGFWLTTTDMGRVASIIKSGFVLFGSMWCPRLVVSWSYHLKCGQSTFTHTYSEIIMICPWIYLFTI